ncbi:MAG: hypothetical protein GX201_02340 [Clostridiales bacterium]|nr:hypothetical protein [Clostridiales bacterium]
MKKTLTSIAIIIVLTSLIACTQIGESQEPYIYNGQTEVNVDGRIFKLEDLPKNMAEETVVNSFLYSIVADFDSKSEILADIESHKISIRNEEKGFNDGLYIKSYTIHEISTLSENEYNQEKLENSEPNPLYYYEWQKIVEKYNLKEYEIINVNFTQVHSETSIKLGSQWGDGTYNRSFIVGKSSNDNNFKIYDFGMM